MNFTSNLDSPLAIIRYALPKRCVELEAVDKNGKPLPYDPKRQPRYVCSKSCNKPLTAPIIVPSKDINSTI